MVYQIFTRICALSVYITSGNGYTHLVCRLARTRFTASPGRHDDRTSTRPPLHAARAATIPTAVRLAAIATPRQGYATLAWAIETDQLDEYLVKRLAAAPPPRSS